jgi:hypothetical protein
MKRLGAAFLLFCVVGVLSSCGLQRTTPGVPEPEYDYSAVVAGIVKLHDDADANFPEHFRQEENPTRLGTEFDPNAYFGVLKHLSMAKGFVLDFAYFHHLDGGPLLHARRKTTPPFKTYMDYEKAVGGKPPIFGGLPETAKAFIDQVTADGSPESFFELVVLYELGGQYYRIGHFYLNDTIIVAAPRDIERVIASHEETFVPFTEDQKRQARRIDAQPRVLFANQDFVGVSLVTFSHFWGGFSRSTYLIRRQFPHTIVDIHEEVLVEYDSHSVI